MVLLLDPVTRTAPCALITRQAKNPATFCCFRHFVVIAVTTRDRAKEN